MTHVEIFQQVPIHFLPRLLWIWHLLWYLSLSSSFTISIYFFLSIKSKPLLSVPTFSYSIESCFPGLVRVKNVAQSWLSNPISRLYHIWYLVSIWVPSTKLSTYMDNHWIVLLSHILKIYSNYRLACKYPLHLFRTLQKNLLTSRLSAKPQGHWPRWLCWVWTQLP